MEHEIRKPRKTENMMQLAGFRDYLRTHPRLMFLFFELTQSCNLSCRHCGSSCASSSQSYVLSKDVVINLLKSIASRYNPKSIMICITGGEPMLRDDLYDIMAEASQMGFYWGMTTNGTLINDRTAEQLKAAGIGSLSVSLDGDENMHDWLRKKAGCYRSVIQGIEALKSSGLLQKTQITTVIHKKNIMQLDKIAGIVKDLGVPSWRIINIEPIGRALDHQDLLLDCEDILTLFNYIAEKRQNNESELKVTYGCSHYLTPIYERELRNYYFICGSGIYVASILHNGDIYSCLDIERRPELIQGNIFKDDFVDVWEHRFQAFRSDRTQKSEMCSVCQDRYVCAGDSAHTWDYDLCLPKLCVKKVLEGL